MYLLYQELNPRDREDRLKTEATTVNEQTYHRTLSDSEIAIREKQHAQDGIELKKRKDELKDTQDRLKTQIKALEEKMESNLETIATRKTQVTGTVYGIADHAESRMLLYDKYGELIDSRPLAPHERQGVLAPERGLPAPGESTVDPNAHVEDIDHEEVTATAEEQIEEMFDGPTIAGHAPAADGENTTPEEDDRRQREEFEAGKPYRVPVGSDAEEMNAKYGDQYGVDWEYQSQIHPDGAPTPGAEPGFDYDRSAKPAEGAPESPQDAPQAPKKRNRKPQPPKGQKAPEMPAELKGGPTGKKGGKK